MKGFRVGHLNIASLVKHVDELKIYLEKEPLDVLSINETRLDETISTDTVSIPGHDMVAKNRNRQGGGVAIYHRSILNVIDRDDLRRISSPRTKLLAARCECLHLIKINCLAL